MELKGILHRSCGYVPAPLPGWEEEVLLQAYLNFQNSLTGWEGLRVTLSPSYELTPYLSVAGDTSMADTDFNLGVINSALLPLSLNIPGLHSFQLSLTLLVMGLESTFQWVVLRLSTLTGQRQTDI